MTYLIPQTDSTPPPSPSLDYQEFDEDEFGLNDESSNIGESPEFDNFPVQETGSSRRSSYSDSQRQWGVQQELPSTPSIDFGDSYLMSPKSTSTHPLSVHNTNIVQQQVNSPIPGSTAPHQTYVAPRDLASNSNTVGTLPTTLTHIISPQNYTLPVNHTHPLPPVGTRQYSEQGNLPYSFNPINRPTQPQISQPLFVAPAIPQPQSIKLLHHDHGRQNMGSPFSHEHNFQRSNPSLRFGSGQRGRRNDGFNRERNWNTRPHDYRQPQPFRQERQPHAIPPTSSNPPGFTFPKNSRPQFPANSQMRIPIDNQQVASYTTSNAISPTTFVTPGFSTTRSPSTFVARPYAGVINHPQTQTSPALFLSHPGPVSDVAHPPQSHPSPAFLQVPTYGQNSPGFLLSNPAPHNHSLSVPSPQYHSIQTNGGYSQTQQSPAFLLSETSRYH
ncbi:hypothetical protein BLNAU_2715 [Blattamonas nauphoetae]|uniref:Uncharacterized protein n=1 Tax=Blattamonas nauphoetae TaxID=2049346 RepID=A0ABQ9YFC1_9EUKA|nr:hypothetical protein BLNAU_2715 [Blattamonas nauphoetae]